MRSLERSIAIIQARMGATRLPGKVLRPLAGRPVLDWVIRAAKEARLVDDVVVATTTMPRDDEVEAAAAAAGIEVIRGSEQDVLSRFILAIDAVPCDAVVRLTADNPLIDPSVIDMTMAIVGTSDVEYAATSDPPSLPIGMGVEVVAADALRRADRHARGVDRTHVTSWLYREPGRARLAGLSFRPRADDLRVTLDTEDDAKALDAIVEALGDQPPSWRDLVAFLRQHPEIAALNADVEQKRLEEG